MNQMDNKSKVKCRIFRQVAPTQFFYFDNNDAQYTVKKLIIPKEWDEPLLYAVKYYNPSTGSALTFNFYDMDNFDANISGQECFLETVAVVALDTTNGVTRGVESKYDSVLNIGKGLAVHCINQSAIGGAGAFVAAMKLYGVYEAHKEVNEDVLY